MKTSVVTLTTGQPLGYYSSWALFALSHHLIVWYSAEQNYPGKRFRNYAILGDDVVIADDNVARNYLENLKTLGVDVSMSKSLISTSGACEFAKRFRLNRCTTDVSAVSIKKLVSVTYPGNFGSFAASLPRKVRFSTLLRIAGFGFKASSRMLMSRSHGKRCRRLIAIYLSGILPVELWLPSVLGYVPAPEVIGMVIERLRLVLKPRDLETPPPAHFPYPGMADFLEWSVYQGWMRDYLHYLKWYAEIALNPSVSLQDLHDPPTYIRTWYRPKTDLSVFKFGLRYRMCDWIDDIVRRGHAVKILQS